MERHQLTEFLCFFSSRRYKDGYNYLVTVPPSPARNLFIAICLIELDRYTDINIKSIMDNIDNMVYEKEHIFFYRMLLKSFDKISYLKKLDFSIKDKYETAILSREYDIAIKHALSLYNENKYYLLFALLLSEKNPSTTKMLNLTFKTILDGSDNYFILYHVVKNKMNIDLIHGPILNMEFKEFIHYLILKEFIINYTDELNRYDILEIDGNIKVILTTVKNDNYLSSFINTLLPRLDDWEIYKIAIKNNIMVKKTNTINYLYYEVMVNKNQESIKEIISRTKSIEEIFKIINITDIKTEDNILSNYLLIIKNIENKESYTPLLKDLYILYKNNNNLFNLKIILSALISTREERYILLALYLIFITEEKNCFLDIINLYLHKYFKINFDKIVEKLELKNTQLLYFIDKNKVKNREYKYKKNYVSISSKETIGIDTKLDNLYFEIIREVNSSIFSFLSNGMIDHGLSLISKKEEINEIFSGERKISPFKDMLGPQCKYLFLEEEKYKTLNFNNEIENIEKKEFLFYVKNSKKKF